MRSIFRYPGGKTKRNVQEWISSHRPAGCREYREPFVGGGGVFFHTPPVAFPVRWVNDINEGLVAVYRALAERPEEFLRLCRQVDPPRPDDPLTDPGVRGGQPVNARLKAVFDRVAFDEAGDQAFRYLFVNRTVFGGRVNYDIPSRVYFSNAEGWNVVEPGRLEKAARWLKGVRVTCGDYEPLFLEPGDGVWVYADPPYVVNTGLTRSSQLYRDNFTEADHRRLAAVVRRSPHRVALSYDDCPLVRDLYPESDGFRLVEGCWSYCGTTNAEKATGRELLVLNYAPSTLFATGGGVDPASAADPLGPEERAELDRREAAIARCLKSFVELGEELRGIRDSGKPSKRIYREWGTFPQYCLKRWGISEAYATRIILAAASITILKTLPIGKVLPSTESQARELTRVKDDSGHLDPGRITEVWGRVIEQAGDAAVTAKMIRGVVEELGYAAPKSVPSPLDRIKQLYRSLSPEDRTRFDQFLTQETHDVVPLPTAV